MFVIRHACLYISKTKKAPKIFPRKYLLTAECYPLQVITTINYPTDTIKLLASAPDWQVVVVADNKTPVDWALDNVVLLSIEDQESLRYNIMTLLPFNHYGYDTPTRCLASLPLLSLFVCATELVYW